MKLLNLKKKYQFCLKTDFLKFIYVKIIFSVVSSFITFFLFIDLVIYNCVTFGGNKAVVMWHNLSDIKDFQFTRIEIFNFKNSYSSIWGVDWKFRRRSFSHILKNHEKNWNIKYSVFFYQILITYIKIWKRRKSSYLPFVWISNRQVLTYLCL